MPLYVCQSHQGNLTVLSADVAADPSATKLLGGDQRAAESAKAVEDDVFWPGDCLDNERRFFWGLSAGMQFSERPDILVDHQRVPRRKFDRLTLLGSDDPDVASRRSSPRGAGDFAAGDRLRADFFLGTATSVAFAFMA